MKQIGSAITGSLKAGETPPSSTGSQHGGIGAAEPRTTVVAPPISEDRLEKVNASLTRFAMAGLKGPVDTDLDAVERALAEVEGCCDWTKAEPFLTEILDGYSRPDVTADVIAIRANDFMRELNEFPTWAVVKAFRWWKSRENKYRYRAPMPGDISERAHKLTEGSRVARKVVDRLNGKPEPEFKPTMTPAQIEEMERMRQRWRNMR